MTEEEKDQRSPKWYKEAHIVWIDLETTGTHQYYDEPVEIGMAKTINGKVVDTFDSRICPKYRLIPEDVSRIHGITNEDVEDSPWLEELADEIKSFTSGCLVGGFNALLFDKVMLRIHLGTRGCIEKVPPQWLAQEWIDPRVFALQHQGHTMWEKGYGLSAMANKANLSWEGRPHSALADSRMTSGILHVMRHVLPESVDELYAAQNKWLDAQVAQNGFPWFRGAKPTR